MANNNKKTTQQNTAKNTQKASKKTLSKSGCSPVNSGAAGDSLGKYTKSSPTCDVSVEQKIRENRAERYELLSTARALFLYAGKQKRLKHPHDFHRTAKCKYISISTVSINKSKKHNKAFFGGLAICGSVWSCPVCTAVVQERRREEIAKAVAWAYKNSMQTAMITLTFPHYFENQLADLIKKQADALARFRRGNVWSLFKNRAGFKGLIRALELTYGSNGWHPHTHELWFLSADFSALEQKEFIVNRWLNCCIAAGLVDANNAAQIAAFKLHAVDIKDHCDASDYLAKNDESKHWGVDRELAKAATKQGKAAGLHAFGLLALAKDDDKSAGAKFVEFSEVMRGKRQLFWSKGLKKAVGIDDLTDEEIAEKETDKADLLGLLEADDWRLVRKAGLRAQVLDAAEMGGLSAVQAILSALRKQAV